MAAILEDSIRNSMDSSLRDYLLSENYQFQIDEIEQLSGELRESLNEEQSAIFMKLMDKINDSDGGFASHAYVKGVAEGIAFRDKFIK